MNPTSLGQVPGYWPQLCAGVWACQGGDVAAVVYEVQQDDGLQLLFTHLNCLVLNGRNQ